MRISRVDLKNGQIALDITDCQPNVPTDERQEALTKAYDEFVTAVLALLELPGDFGRHETRADKGMECSVCMRYRPPGISTVRPGLQHTQLDLYLAPRKADDA
jgi:hypothetical protein